MLDQDPKDKEKLFSGVVRLNGQILGLALGLLLGVIIFIATNLLVLKGGPIGHDGKPIVGPHLQLLGQFFIGYRVSFLGSFIGFAYGFTVGTIGGALVSRIYNWIVDFRNK